MSIFIAFNYITDNGGRGGALVNVNEIETVTLFDNKVYLKPKSRWAFHVDHNLEEVMQMIEKAGSTIVKPAKNDQDTWNPILYTEISQAEFTRRTANCFQYTNIRYFWQLVKYSELQLLREVKNFGRKSLNEVKEFLGENNLSLGMDLTGFDPQGAQ